MNPKKFQELDTWVKFRDLVARTMIRYAKLKDKLLHSAAYFLLRKQEAQYTVRHFKFQRQNFNFGNTTEFQCLWQISVISFLLFLFMHLFIWKITERESIPPMCWVTLEMPTKAEVEPKPESRMSPETSSTTITGALSEIWTESRAAMTQINILIQDASNANHS